jgi:hypothetical protein
MQKLVPEPQHQLSVLAFIFNSFHETTVTRDIVERCCPHM